MGNYGGYLNVNIQTTEAIKLAIFEKGKFIKLVSDLLLRFTQCKTAKPLNIPELHQNFYKNSTL